MRRRCASSDTRGQVLFISLAMHREEGRRAKGKDDMRTMPMNLDLWEDDWKR